MADHVRTNLRLWQRQSDEYDRRHQAALAGPRAMAWGLWRIPESSLRLLGDVPGREILEIGCGAARWSIALAGKGAKVVGLDLSTAQLAHARRLNGHAGSRVRFVRGDAEHLPFRAGTFDLAFSDWGALTFCDPYRTIPEAARVLRPGGRLVFATSSPFRNVAQDRRSDRVGRTLRYDYFGLHRVRYPQEINFQLPYGDWIRLFARHDLLVESLTENRPGPGERSSYLAAREERWARRWPLESIWQLRKTGSSPVPGVRRRPHGKRPGTAGRVRAAGRAGGLA